jgi:putative DNA methylase
VRIGSATCKLKTFGKRLTSSGLFLPDIQGSRGTQRRLCALVSGRLMGDPKISPAEIARPTELANPWSYFTPSFKGEPEDAQEIEGAHFPLDVDDYPGLSIRWRRDIDQADKLDLRAKALATYPTNEERAGLCKRPEEMDEDALSAPIWPAVNAHLGHLGIEAQSHQELVKRLGILRFGHRPRVGDTFCGGGSIPFEAARLGCDVYASDLNPIARMLTWGALNIMGATPEKRAAIEKAQREVAEAVDREIAALGIEHDSKDNRAKAYLHCLEVLDKDTGWRVPMARTWVISKTRSVIAKLVPDRSNKRFEIKVLTGVQDAYQAKRLTPAPSGSGWPRPPPAPRCAAGPCGCAGSPTGSPPPAGGRRDSPAGPSP